MSGDKNGRMGTGETGRTLEYQPALDGVRAVAVAAVLLFHGGYGWFSGGYLGVSVFFTLSGFLITSVLLVEEERSATVSLARFYTRRATRLLPASLLCLAGIVVATRLGVFDGVNHMRRDLWGALGQVANWVLLRGDSSYQDLIDATAGRISPLDHYWSLAIEEQFYWVWPIAMLGLSRVAATRRSRAAVLAGGYVAAVVAAPLIARWFGPDAAYWATPARAGEILAGALLAAVLLGRRVPAWFAGLGVAGLGAILVSCLLWPAGRGPAYQGWLPIFALASAALIAGLQVPSLLRRALSAPPLVRLGTISYGVYLYHWPVFAAFDKGTVPFGHNGLFLVRVCVTVALAAVSYRFVEKPVRGARLAPRRALVAGLATCLLVAVAIVAAPRDSAVYAVGNDRAERAAVAIDETGTVTPLSTIAPTTTSTGVASASATNVTPASVTAPATTAPPGPLVVDRPAVQPSRPVRIMVVGDSTADSTGRGLVTWAAAHPDLAQVTMLTQVGCGMLRGGVVPTDGDMPYAANCNRLIDEQLPAALADLDPDVVLVMVTVRDVEDRQWDPVEGLLSPFDDRFRQRLQESYEALHGQLVAAGARVVWVRGPLPSVVLQGEAVKMGDPARFQVQYDVIEGIAAQSPDVTVIDLQAWLDSYGNEEATAPFRVDGLHWAPAIADMLAETYLGPLLVDATLGVSSTSG